MPETNHTFSSKIRLVWSRLGRTLNNEQTKKMFNHVERKQGVLVYKKHLDDRPQSVGNLEIP